MDHVRNVLSYHNCCRIIETLNRDSLNFSLDEETYVTTVDMKAIQRTTKTVGKDLDFRWVVDALLQLQFIVYNETNYIVAKRLFVLREVERDSQLGTSLTRNLYYILDGNIFKSPRVFDVFRSRFRNVTKKLKSTYECLFDNVIFDVSGVSSWKCFPNAQREEQKKDATTKSKASDEVARVKEIKRADVVKRAVDWAFGRAQVAMESRRKRRRQSGDEEGA
eukprot:g926.t1